MFLVRVGPETQGLFQEGTWGPRLLPPFGFAISCGLVTCHLYLAEQERGSMGIALEVFMDRIGNDVYHFFSRPLARTPCFMIWLHLFAREAGKKSITVCPGRRGGHGVWMPGERIVCIDPVWVVSAPSVLGKCSLVAIWFLGAHKFSSLWPWAEIQLCSSTALSGLECSFLSPLASVAIPLPSISLPPFSSDESLPSSEVSIWVWSVHANILFMLNVISIPLKYRKSPFILCFLLISSLHWGNEHSLATWLGGGKEKVNYWEK